ncbi:GGDEF domain-containing protein [Lujinxingia litoralis]|nr:GGDEF domain-containing protein [Lujinxingia litoralis]
MSTSRATSCLPSPQQPSRAFGLLLGLLLGLVLPLLVPPNADAHALAPLNLNAQESLSLAGRVHVIADPEHRFTPADLPTLWQMAQTRQDAPRLSYEVGRHVLLFEVINTAPDPHYVLSFLLPTLQRVELIARPLHGGTPQMHSSGRSIHAHERALPVIGHNLPLVLNPGEPYRVALFIESPQPPSINLREIEIQSLPSFNRHVLRLQIVLLLSLGALLALALHSLSLWTRVRERIYLYFAGYTLASTLLWLTQYEVLRLLWLPATNTDQLNLSANNAMVLCVLLFSREFLHLHQVAPRLGRIFDIAAIVVALLLALNPLVDYATAYHLQASAAGMALALMALGTWQSWRAGVLAARLFTLAFSLLFISASLTIVDPLLPALPTATLRLATLTSTAMGMLIMAYAVAERMHQLQGRASWAERLARTDGLTGLRNRAAFDADIAALIADERPRDLLVVFCDVDGLKRINDDLGHRRGDELLEGFARELRRGFREVDHIYRIGGDEFVLLLFVASAPDPQGWLQERLASALQNLRAAGFASADVSVGVAHLHEVDGNPADALALADSRMYHAKKSKKRADSTPARLPV